MKATTTKDTPTLPDAAAHERQTNGTRSFPFTALECDGVNTRAKRRQPRMSRHSSGQARVLLSGKVHYLGTFGSPEAHEKYAELVKRWQAGDRQPLQQTPHAGQAVATVRDLLAQHRELSDELSGTVDRQLTDSCPRQVSSGELSSAAPS